MREINVSDLIPIIKKICIESNYYLGDDVLISIEEFQRNETSDIAKEVLSLLLENYKLAAQERMPICQDTGLAIFFLEIGQDIHFHGGNLTEAINEGVRQGYKEGYLRKSVVKDPVLNRINTNDNTPAIIYSEIVPGNKLKISFSPKGGGSENMSEVRMLKPADGLKGVMDFVVERVKKSGGNPCPPIIVGVGIGGNFEQSALMAKKSLLRPLNEYHPDPKWKEIEIKLLEEINKTGIGPQGLGGITTALKVNILTKPCHIASLPVAVNIQCHAARHKTIII